jgi:hypothetical protein
VTSTVPGVPGAVHEKDADVATKPTGFATAWSPRLVRGMVWSIVAGAEPNAARVVHGPSRLRAPVSYFALATVPGIVALVVAMTWTVWPTVTRAGALVSMTTGRSKEPIPFVEAQV